MAVITGKAEAISQVTLVYDCVLPDMGECRRLLGRWENIVEDLNSGNPEFYDIRRLWKGQQTRRKTGGGNLHCIMAFEKSVSLQGCRHGLNSCLDSCRVIAPDPF